MRAAYGTFLSSLLMIKAHDMVADQAAAEYNVTWTRTTPIVVSVYDDAYSTTMTLKCDHRFGMDVVGDPEDVKAFRYACSSAINPIEHQVMETLFPGGGGRSITIGLAQMILNGEMVDVFISNGYQVMMSSIEDLYLVLDLESGIVRDVMITYMPMSGAYCFSDLQTEWASELCEDLLNNQSGLFDSIGDLSISFGSVVALLGTLTGLGEGSILLIGELFAPALFVLGPLAFLEAIQPLAIEEAEEKGLFNFADYYKNNNLIDQGWDIMLQMLGMGTGPPQGVWDESDEYTKAAKEKSNNEWKSISDSLWEFVEWSIELNLNGNIIDLRSDEDIVFEDSTGVPTSLGSGDIGKPIKIGLVFLIISTLISQSYKPVYEITQV